MKKGILAICILLALAVWTSTAFGLAPLGPPTAGLKQGQFGAAVEYTYGDSDLEISRGTLKTTINGVQSNMLFIQPSYGLTDDWELYVPLGGSDTEMGGLRGSYEFACGVGTKITFSQDANVSYGLLFEIGWRKFNDIGPIDLSDVGLSYATYAADVKYHEMMVALGPTLKVAEGLKLYGGPFFYVLEGDLYIQSTSPTREFDISEGAMFGGYIGAEIDLCPNSSFYAEFQITDDMQIFGTGISWKF